jgi:hypothetical protein
MIASITRLISWGSFAAIVNEDLLVDADVKDNP